MRVWITDDDTIFHFIIERFAQSLPQVEELRFFTNGSAMVNALQHTKKGPDVLLLDINMPIMNGFEVMEYLHKNPDLSEKIKSAFVISSSMIPDEKEQALSYSFVSGFYSKPIFVQQFVEIVLGTATQDRSSDSSDT